MGNRDYDISTSLTGDKGRDFMNLLSDEQADCINRVILEQGPLLKEIVLLRTDVSMNLREAIDNKTPDKEKTFSLIRRYGEIDGELSYSYAMCFAQINKTLTAKQRKELKAIRDLDVYPKGTFLFSDPIEMPVIEDTGFLFR
jgi:hypothetical protein